MPPYAQFGATVQTSCLYHVVGNRSIKLPHEKDIKGLRGKIGRDYQWLKGVEPTEIRKIMNNGISLTMFGIIIVLSRRKTTRLFLEKQSVQIHTLQS